LGFVDTHVHFWDLSQFDYPWLESEESARIRANYLPEQFADDLVGVDIEAFVHVQAEVDHSIDPVAETAWLAAILSEAGGAVPPAVCVGYADLRSQDLDDILARHAEYDLLHGIRQEAWFDPDSTDPGVLREDLLADPAWARGLRTLVEHDLSFDLLISADQLQRACDVFREVPEVSVILDHTGVPTLVDGVPPPEWRTGLRRFADEVPRGVLKVSGIGFIDPDWELAHVAPLVHEAIEIFGPERCMLGSNFPVDRPYSTYAELWEAYEAISSDLSSSERSALFRDTARRVYRIADLRASDRGAANVTTGLED
jgi:predicted TIM-barrel fold metal-dependent hydrolase